MTGKTERQWHSAMTGEEPSNIQEQIANSLKAWAKPTSRPRDRSQTDGSPRLSRRALLIGAAGLAVASGAARVVASVTHPPAALPTFEQITSQVGIAFRHRRHHSAHAIQAGAAFFDLNGNGRQDLFLTNAHGPNALFRNNGDATFTDIADKSGLAGPHEITIGVACADYDNDGNCDLLATRIGGLNLFHNNGDGTFSDVTQDAGLEVEGYHPASAVWADFDGNGYLDLYVTYWIDGSPPAIRGKSLAELREEFTPLARQHRLFQNNGNGTFRDVTHLLGQSSLHGAGLAAGFLDYDDDGRPDLFVVNDFGQFIEPNVLYRNAGPARGDWSFKDVSDQARVDAAIDGMGLAVGDYDGDSRLDMFVTNMGDNVLYRNNGGEIFEDTTGVAGVGRGEIPGEHSVGWGTAFLDFDNDGLLDIYFVAGRLHPAMNAAGQYLPDQPNALFHNRGDGTFRDVSKQTASDHNGCARGLAVADVDGDGFLDMLVSNMDQPPVLLKNSGNDNRWLEVQLVGVQSNRDGIGARLTLTAGGARQIREIQSGTSFLSQHSLVAHFGLGRHQRVDELQIRWPSGIVQTLTDLPVNRMITVTEAV